MHCSKLLLGHSSVPNTPATIPRVKSSAPRIAASATHAAAAARPALVALTRPFPLNQQTLRCIDARALQFYFDQIGPLGPETGVETLDKLLTGLGARCLHPHAVGERHPINGGAPD